MTIVQIEDSLDDICLFAEAFREWGKSPVEIVSFQSGAEAISWMESIPDHPPDLVVLDLNLPGLSGFDVLERMRAQGFPISPRILVLTTSCSGDDREKSLRLGADGFLTKPPTWGDYRHLVKKLEMGETGGI